MGVETPAAKPVERTEQDREEQWKSVLWFHDQRSAGKLGDYLGKYVAILGEEIIDADPDADALCSRLEANHPPEANIVIQDMHPFPNWK